MKTRQRYLHFSLLLLLFSAMFSQQALCGSTVLRYEDDQGRLVLVDSAADVPKRYLNQVEVVPSGSKA